VRPGFHHFLWPLVLWAACSPSQGSVSGTWRGSIRDTVTCNPCRALYGFSLRESRDRAITGIMAADVSFEHDAASGAARVHGARTGDTVDILFLPVQPETRPQGRQGIKGVLDPDGRSIRAELWFAPRDTTAREQRLPIILVRAELDSALVALLSEAKVQ